MQKKKLLLITYYWPPCGGVGVLRWLKMVKYLAKDFEITVYAPLNPDYPSIDESLLEEIPNSVKIIKNKIFEPYNLFRKLTFKSKDYTPKQEFAAIKDKSTLEDLALWVRGNFFIPDARCYWVKPSINFLKAKLQEERYDYVVTNGTPHSVHLIGLGLRKQYNFKWIADLRDPWTEVDYFDKLKLSKWAYNKHVQLENKVITTADIVTTVSESWAENLENLGAEKVDVIYNGYDELDFKSLKKIKSEKIIVSHVGSLNEERNKEEFWLAIRSLIDNDLDLKNKLEIRLVGNLVSSVKQMVDKYQLHDIVTIVGRMTHRESLQEMMNADVLLLFLGDLNDKGRIPAKLFEYLATKNKIFAIADSESDVGNILKNSPQGFISDLEQDRMIEVLKEVVNKIEINNRDDIANESFSRKYQAMKLKSYIYNI